MNRPIERLNLSRRAYNALKRGEINTVGDILAAGIDDLLKIRNFGYGSLAEVTRELESLGHTLTEHGQPAAALPALPSAAAALVNTLGLGDTRQVRMGLARVLATLATTAKDPADLLRFVPDLEGSA